PAVTTQQKVAKNEPTHKLRACSLSFLYSTSLPLTFSSRPFDLPRHWCHPSSTFNMFSFNSALSALLLASVLVAAAPHPPIHSTLHLRQTTSDDSDPNCSNTCAPLKGTFEAHSSGASPLDECTQPIVDQFTSCISCQNSQGDPDGDGSDAEEDLQSLTSICSQVNINFVTQADGSILVEPAAGSGDSSLPPETPEPSSQAPAPSSQAPAPSAPPSQAPAPSAPPPPAAAPSAAPQPNPTPAQQTNSDKPGGPASTSSSTGTSSSPSAASSSATDGGKKSGTGRSVSVDSGFRATMAMGALAVVVAVL
ncbi:hypothetical protein FB45DRAFT_446977, partial [Roridomyces roridus]